MRKGILYIVLVLSINYSCVTPFEFQTDTFEKVIVVEGSISNEAKSHIVKLSYTYPLGSSGSSTSITDAQVFVVSSSDQFETFEHDENGIYKSRDNWSGIAGESYHVVIITSDNERYESNSEELKSSPLIDSIYQRFAELPSVETNQNEPGIQFFIDAHDETNSAEYFRYEWEETYRVIVPFPSLYEAEDTLLVLRKEQVGICYQNDSSNILLIATSINNTENRIAEFPLHFIFSSSQHIRSRISILAKQYAITEKAYEYYRKLKENSESKGSLFDKQAGGIVGNVFSVTNSDELVLGYFEVAGYSEKRAFFSASNFDERFQQADFQYSCKFDEAFHMHLDSARIFVSRFFTFQIYYFFPGPETMQDSAYIYPRICTSCDWYADNFPPDFWID